MRQRIQSLLLPKSGLPNCYSRLWLREMVSMTTLEEFLLAYISNSGQPCPKGNTKVFTTRSGCWVRQRKYCCPSHPLQLVDCHWASGSGGTDCVNAKCSATEAEIDRDQWGDGGPGCSCKSLSYLHGIIFQVVSLYPDKELKIQ